LRGQLWPVPGPARGQGHHRARSHRLAVPARRRALPGRRDVVGARGSGSSCAPCSRTRRRSRRPGAGASEV